MPENPRSSAEPMIGWPPSRRLAGLAGMAVPLVFWTGIVLATWLAWDFLHDHGWTLTSAVDSDVPWPSGTALADGGIVQSANFAVTGLLLLVFVRGLRRELPRPRSGRVAGTLLTIAAIALIASAFNTDMGGDQPATWHGWVHLVAFFVLMLSSITGLVATAVALRGDPRWRGYGAAAVAVAVIIPLSEGLVPNESGFYVVVVALFGWFGAAGLRLWRLGRAEAPADETPATMRSPERVAT